MTVDIKWDIETDVLVAGGGGAGLVAAIEAHDAGAQVLVLEKMPHLGGITILAGGGIKAANDIAGAETYLTHTQGGRVKAPLIRAFAEGLYELPRQLEQLAKVNGGTISVRNDAHEGVYQFPGRDAFLSLTVSDIPGFKGYPWTYTGKNLSGQRFFKVLLDNVETRGIRVETAAPVRSLITDATGAVIGAWADIKGARVSVKARRGVVLACGGFEFNEKLKKEFFEATPIYSMGNPGNTGDGILMAQKVGAALWHMWHFHGSYGFKFDDFDAAFRIAPGGARNSSRPIAWILLDKGGRRFMNELHPACQDTAARPLGVYDPEILDYPRIPALMVFDEAGRRLGRIANPLTSHPEHRYEWSEDNLAEVTRGWIRRYDTLTELAAGEGLSEEAATASIDRWNAAVATGVDADFSRPPGTMVSLREPPFYAVRVWPILTNTQGGPEHDERQRVLDAFGEAIPRLYAAGECGSFFAHLYLLGGNLSELLISGRIAARDVADLEAWDTAPAQPLRQLRA